MKRSALALLCSLPLLASAAAASAAPDGQCVKFSEQRQTARFGSQHLLVRDEGRHYRVSFVGNQCGAISAAAKVRLFSGDEQDTLCGDTGRVSTRAGVCRVAEVEEIDADTFAQLTRRRR